MKGPLRILLIEDDSTTVALTKMFLEKLNAEIYTCANGKEALDYLHACCPAPPEPCLCPEIILLDLNMPVMDGFEFLEAYETDEKIRKENINIIVVSSSESIRDKHKVSRFNQVRAYISKPVTDIKLKKIMNAGNF